MNGGKTMAGSKFLKITSIILIVGGAFGIVWGIIALLGVAALAALGANTTFLTWAGVFVIVAAVIELIAGISGLIGSQEPAKGAKCYVWGIVIIVVSVISQILTVAGGGDFNFLSLVLGLVLPILYICGSLMIKKELDEAENDSEE
jgi:hypothetical protein